MGWERSKPTITELPPQPSYFRWLMAGSVATVMGILLFILHTSDMIKAQAVFNIWWVASSPVIGWFLLFCF